MKRLIAIVAVITLAAGMAAAAPTIYGSNGLFRTISARNAGKMNFGVGVYLYGWGYSNDSTATSPKDGAMDMVIVPSGYFSINNMFELSVAANYLMPSQYVYHGGTKYTFNTSGPGDTRVGLKVSIPAGESLWLAAYAGYDIPTLDKVYLPGNGYDHNGGINFMLLGDVKVGEHGCMSLNAGMYYNLDHYYQHTSLTDSSVVNVYPNMSLPFGVGFSYDMGMLTPYIELSAEYKSDTTTYLNEAGTGTVKRGVLDDPIWAGAGLRFYVSGLNITAGGEYNLQTDNRPASPIYSGNDHWHAILGLAYAPKRERGPRGPAIGSIIGKVTDQATGNGLLATVSAGGITANTNQAGEYRLDGITIVEAPVEVRAEARRYISGSASVPLTRKNRKVPAVQDFALALKPIPQSEISGNVIDYKTGNPLPAATLSFKETMGTVQTATANAKGAYFIKLNQGKYSVKAAADGYYPKSMIVNCADGKPVSRDVALVKIHETFVFNDVNFKFDKSSLTPRATEILQAMAKILKDNPEIRVEIGGHTDSKGSNAYNQKLSEDRANSAREYLISVEGIDANRMSHKGYGEESPIATNKTNAGRALNRRMEVTVFE